MRVTDSPALMLSISAIRQETVVGAERIRDAAVEMGVPAGLILSVQRDRWHIKNDPAALEFIHESAAQGHEMLLGGLGPLKAQASPGEFHRLAQHESALRLTAAQRQLDALGLHPRVFAPTRWLASDQARAAARSLGFSAMADAYHVHSFEENTSRNVRVLAFGDGFGAARWWRRNVALSVNRKCQRRQDVRLSISATKAGRSDVVRDFTQLVQALVDAGYCPLSYADYAASSYRAAA